MNKKKTRMYDDVKTWNPCIGCRFACRYCKPSFQLQQKRYSIMQAAQGRPRCQACEEFTPHEHGIHGFPSKKYPLVWPCAHGDLSFASSDTIRKVIEETDKHPDRQYYWQSKDPRCLAQYLPLLHENSSVDNAGNEQGRRLP